jgi:parallel beta-helix repeat protein
MSARFLSLLLSAFVAALGVASTGSAIAADQPKAQSVPTVPGDSSDTSTRPPGPKTGAACYSLPPMPARPAKVRSVNEFGVTPSDTDDRTDAIQRALNSLAPGDWLVFPPGRYIHSKTLHVKVPGTVLWGEGATLHATTPGDMAVMLEAEGASIYKFTLTAVTDRRRSAPWESRIAVFGGSKPGRLLKGNIIRGNRVMESGEPGSPLANSSSSAAIFVYYATDFLVAENTVSRSLSDGIHVTSGSSYGRVLNNTVRQTGDDMIAVVSYVGDPSQSAETIAADFDERKARGLSHHIVIANNTVSGQYWGRGISVVGGENVVIEHNSIDRTTHGAAIYLARETSFLTFGVRNVLVRDNTISDVQTTNPDFIGGTVNPAAPKTGHGAIEVYSWLYTDEAANDKLKEELSVQDIRIESNTINRAKADGVRIGTGWGRVWSYTGKKKDGSSFTRSLTGGQVGRIALKNNKMTSVGGQAIAINNQPTERLNIACEANAQEGKVAVQRLCGGKAPVSVPDCPW